MIIFVISMISRLHLKIKIKIEVMGNVFLISVLAFLRTGNAFDTGKY